MTAPARFDLGGLVALVTGASSGIGREIAGALAEAGAAVVLVARRAQQLAAAQREVEAVGGRAATLTADLANGAALLATAERAASFFGAPDIVVNAAGINIRKPMVEVTRADWDAILAINLDGAILSGAGVGAGNDCEGVGTHYQHRFAAVSARVPDGCALRRLEGWDRTADARAGGSLVAARRERERDSSRILCNRTDRACCQRRGALAEDGRQHFFGRNGELGDLRGTAVFLASRASDYVTGQTIFVDGGFSAG